MNSSGKYRSIAATAAALIALALAVAGCSSGQAVQSSPTPLASATAVKTVATLAPTATAKPSAVSTAVTPTPPAPPNAAFMAMALLVSSLGAPASEFSVASFEETSWTDAGLGCPEPGVFYAQLFTPGWKIVLARGAEYFQFHTDRQGNNIVNCTERWARAKSLVNVARVANLAQATEVVILRRNMFSLEFREVATVTDAAEVARFAALLDLDIQLAEPSLCQTAFQLVYRAPGRTETFDFICETDYRVLRGAQAFWGGKEGKAPVELANLVGPYVSKEPLPPLPPGP
jgi:hypothetical protein